MSTNIINNYSVNTVYSTERHQGSLASIISRQYRFCAFEPVADDLLPCGVFVTLVADAMGNYRAKPLASANDKVYGVSFYNEQRILVWSDALKAFQYQKDDIVSLIEEGDIFMYSEVAVNIGDDVFARHTANGGLNRIGALANAAGTGLVAIPGAKFVKKTTSAGLTVVSLPDII